MLVDFSKPIFDMLGSPVVVGTETLTLKTVALNALTATFEDERNLTGEDKMNRFSLALTISNSQAPVSLTPEQISLVKQLIGKGYSTLVVGRAYEILNG